MNEQNSMNPNNETNQPNDQQNNASQQDQPQNDQQTKEPKPPVWIEEMNNAWIAYQKTEESLKPLYDNPDVDEGLKQTLHGSSKTQLEENLIKIMRKHLPNHYGEFQWSNPFGSNIPPTADQRTKLFRRQDDKIIAGVCSGLADYFSIDTAISRVVIAFATIITLPFGGFGLLFVLLYFILALLLPVKEDSEMT